MLPAPLRLAFVGQQTFFRACAWEEDSARATTTFIEFREGRDPDLLREQLHAFAPDAIVVFRPETIPHGVLADFAVPILGFLTEPISRTTDGDASHWDLEQRRAQTARMDQQNVDRIVSFDPLIVPTVDAVMEVWRSLPIPVADRLYRDVRRPVASDAPPHMLFVGRSTVHREAFLRDVKHRFDVLHVAFGIQVDELEQLLDKSQITFNIHNEPYPSFENRVLLHLAAGHLVISEPLSPTHGLEPGVDFVEVHDPDALTRVASAARADPAAFLPVRVRGRQKAELVRASRVWPALVRDLVADLRAFGTHREATASALSA